jgi:hypothetical protein
MVAPDAELARGAGEDATHAATRGVIGTHPCQEIWYDFMDMGWTLGQRGKE